MKTTKSRNQAQFILVVIVATVFLSCSLTDRISLFGKDKSTPASGEVLTPEGPSNVTLLPSIERISIGDKNIFRVSVGGVNYLMKVIPPDQKDLSNLQVGTLDLGGQKMVVLEDPDGEYLPEITFLGPDDPEQVVIAPKIKQTGDNQLLNAGFFTRRNLSPGAIIQAFLGNTTLAGLIDFLGPDYTNSGLGVILGMTQAMSENTGLRIFRTFYPGIYLALPRDLLPGDDPAVGQEYSLDNPYPDFILENSIVMRGQLPPIAGLLARIQEGNQAVAVANFTDFTLDDISWLRFQAIARVMGLGTAQTYAQGLTASALSQADRDLITRYIESVILIDGRCAKPEDTGKIYAQYPPAGTSIIPDQSGVTLYYCSEVSTEQVKITQVRFSLDPASCPVLENPPVVDVVLVIDVSGSMEGSRLAAAKSSANNFISQLNPETDRVGLVSFESSASQLSDLTGDFASVSALINGLESSGGTAIDAGLTAGHAVIQNASRPEAERVVMLLTDGGSDPAPARAAADLIKADGITLLTVGVGPGTDQALLQSLASNPADALFSNTNQGLQVLFDETAKRLTGRFLARDVSMTLQVDTRNYAVIDSMLTNGAVMASRDRIEWSVPYVFEGQGALRPVVLRPLNANNEPLGTLQVTYNQCYDGPQVVVDPEVVEINASNLTNLSGDVLSAGTTFNGSLEPFKSFGYLMEVQEPGLYSVIVNGAGSELAPEVTTDNGDTILYPLYTYGEVQPSSSLPPVSAGKLLKPSLSTVTDRTSVFLVKDPMMFWLQLLSNSPEDSGSFSISMMAGAVDDPPDYQVGEELTTPMVRGQAKVYDLLGVKQGDTITIVTNHSVENSQAYASIVSLDGEYALAKYYMSYYGSDQDSSKFTRVYEILGEGPYKLVFTAPDGDAYLKADMGDALANNSGSIQYGQTVDATLQAERVDTWYFQPNPGDGLKFTLKRQNSGYLYLYGPKFEDKYIYAQAYGYEGEVILGPFEVPVEGEYTIVVQDYSQDNSPYQLTLEVVALPEPTNQPITSGETVNGTLIGGRQDQYTFEGLSGQTITVHLTAAEDAWYLYPEMKLLGPDGEVIMETQTYYQEILWGPLELLADGTYTLLVSGSMQSGTYDLSLEISE
jgi:uncharacterized protein YegL